MAEGNNKKIHWEALKAKKRRESVKQMKENGITYDQADDEFLDMMERSRQSKKISKSHIAD